MNLSEATRAFLAAWLSFKHTSHPALGEHADAVRQALSKQIAELPISAAAARAERLRQQEEIAAEWRRQQEERAEEWARQQVRGTEEALLKRQSFESLGCWLKMAGAIVETPCSLSDYRYGDTFDGLLANSTSEARAEENDHSLDVDYEDGDLELDFPQYDDMVGYIEDYSGQRTRRHSRHGVYGRVVTEKSWIAGEKVKAQAPGRPKQQKQALVAHARGDVAEARRLRMSKKAKRDTLK